MGILDSDGAVCDGCGLYQSVDYHTIGDIYRAMLCIKCANKITRDMIFHGLQAKIETENSKIRAIEYGVDETVTRIKSEIEEMHSYKNMLQRELIVWIETWFKTGGNA